VQVAALRAFHHKAQTQADKRHMAQFGLDLVEGKVRNNVEAGVLEPTLSKVKMIQVGTRVRVTGLDDGLVLVRAGRVPLMDDTGRRILVWVTYNMLLLPYGAWTVRPMYGLCLLHQLWPCG
jgi:hypothetical protein